MNKSPFHRGLALLALAAGLLGCTTAPAPVEHAPSLSIATATLARVGTCEVDVAADYTALIANRRLAAALLRAKHIGVTTAEQVQDAGDIARKHLDAACPAGRLDTGQREQARIAIGTMSKLLGSARK